MEKIFPRLSYFLREEKKDKVLLSVVFIIVAIITRVLYSNTPTSMNVDFVVVPMFIIPLTALFYNTKIDIFSGDTSMVSASAFVQQRSKILPSAFESVFKGFINIMNPVKLFEGYRLLAVDGSDIRTPVNPDDPDSYCKQKDSKPYSLYHLNAIYDLLSHTYLDAVVQKRRNRNEHRALCNMVDRYDFSVPSIFTADRGYESYNNMAHIQQINQFFLFRVKDIHSNGILKGFILPDKDQFDFPVSLTLTNKQTKFTKNLCKDHNRFRFNPSTSNFDFLPAKSKHSDPPSFFNLVFRIVRIEVVPGKYEVLLTNLPTDSFSPEKLKYLYSLRWGIETSFRSLKYTVGLLCFHSKKPEFLKQEIYATLVQYNFGVLLANEAASVNKHIKRDPENKHQYEIDFGTAIKASRKYFNRKPDEKPIDIIKLLCKFVHVVKKEFRQFSRPLRGIGAIHFLYR